MMVAKEFTAGIKMNDGNWTGMIGQMTRGYLSSERENAKVCPKVSIQEAYLLSISIIASSLHNYNFNSTAFF